MLQAAMQQMGKLWHTSNVYLHPNLHEYAAKLTAKLPDPLKVCTLLNSPTPLKWVAIKSEGVQNSVISP